MFPIRYGAGLALHAYPWIMAAGLLLSGCGAPELRGTPTDTSSYSLPVESGEEPIAITRFFEDTLDNFPENHPVAEVNGKIITLQQMRLLLKDRLIELAATSSSRAELNALLWKHWNDVLQNQIDDYLILQLAEDMDLEVPDKQIHQEIDNYMKNNDFKSLEEYTQWLNAKGTTIEQHRELLEKILLLRLIKKTVIAPKVVISPMDIYTYYHAHEDEFITPVEFRIATIDIPKENGREEAEQVLQAVRKPGADFGIYAEDYGASNGGLSRDWHKQGDLIQEMEDLILPLQVGEVSDILETENFYRLTKLVDKRGGSIISLEQSQDMIKRKLAEKKHVEETEKLLKKLRQEAHIRIYAIPKPPSP